MSSWRTPALAAVAGLALTLVVSLRVGMTAADSLHLIAWAGGAALVTGALGAVGLWLLRRRSLGVQVAVVALIAVGAVGAGVFAAGWKMYVAAADLRALAVVVVAGGTVGIVAALLLGRRVIAGSRDLSALARRIGDGPSMGSSVPVPAVPAPGELAALSAELVAMSERLGASRAAEQALETSRRELVAWVSHDLRTPLAGIRAITEALEDGVVDDDATVARYYRTLRTEADRLSDLVDDLFELSRIQAGAIRLERHRASLGDLVSDAIAAAHPVAAAKGVRLEGRLDGEPLELEIAMPEVSRVLRNLLENAIRHTPSDGTVWVQAGSDEEAAFVSVADACGGIAPAELGRVFDLAYRGTASRTPGDGGGGLGLAIAKGLVEAHDGQIAVTNDGPGCRFTVRLPLVQAS